MLVNNYIASIGGYILEIRGRIPYMVSLHCGTFRQMYSQDWLYGRLSKLFSSNYKKIEDSSCDKCTSVIGKKKIMPCDKCT